MKKIILIPILFCLSFVCNSQAKNSSSQPSIDLILKTTYVPIQSKTDLSIKINFPRGYFYSAASGKIRSVLVNGIEVVSGKTGQAVYSEDYRLRLLEMAANNGRRISPDLIYVPAKEDDVTTLIIDHVGGFQTRYIGRFSCDSRIKVESGDWIGSIIKDPSVSSEIDSQITFELWKDGKLINPYPYINKKKSNLKMGIGVSIENTRMGIDSTDVVNLAEVRAFIDGVPMSVDEAVAEIGKIASEYGSFDAVYVYPDRGMPMKHVDAFMEKLIDYNPLYADCPELPICTKYVDAESENSVVIKINSINRMLMMVRGSSRVVFDLEITECLKAINYRGSFRNILVKNGPGTQYYAYVGLLEQIMRYYDEERDREAMRNYGKTYCNLSLDEKKVIDQSVPYNVYRLR